MKWNENKACIKDLNSKSFYSLSYYEKSVKVQRHFFLGIIWDIFPQISFFQNVFICMCYVVVSHYTSTKLSLVDTDRWWLLAIIQVLFQNSVSKSTMDGIFKHNLLHYKIFKPLQQPIKLKSFHIVSVVLNDQNNQNSFAAH